ncbi:MAG: hypothetical protein H0W50_00745 [Parachlamydiaceae bacterium]|nr:hypothetical protein [Parachlamydiaceae bacterium]
MSIEDLLSIIKIQSTYYDTYMKNMSSINNGISEMDDILVKEQIKLAFCDSLSGLSKGEKKAMLAPYKEKEKYQDIVKNIYIIYLESLVLRS